MTRNHVKIAIIGAGFSGLAMAIRLKQQGLDDFVILEKGDDVGGAWHHNTYPGCRCDIPSHLYSLSFAPNPEWSHTYSGQGQIRDYLRGCADRFGLRPHLRTGAGMRAAAWLDEEGVWGIDTATGPLRADLLVCGMGPLDEPMIPAIPGLESFEGKVMHSARWDHGYDLTGKRVASIGTGASAIQYVPEIQPRVARLHVFQRTAPWIMPHGNRAITDRERLIYRRIPLAQRLVRAGVYLSKEVLVFGFVKHPKLMTKLENIAQAHMRKHIRDPELLAKVTPDYTLGCKRILPSNRWYPALAKPNVELVTGPVREIRANSIVGADGVEREIDAIILGTGFHVTDMPASDLIRGRDGRLMREVFQGSPRAYLGTSVPGFPNFFLLLGPNTGLGHGSMVYMIEAQVEHIVNTIRAMRRRGATRIEIRPEAHERFNRDVDARLRGTIWDTGGCTSFYLDAHGRNATLWPDWTWRFRRLAKRPVAASYRITGNRTIKVAS